MSRHGQGAFFPEGFPTRSQQCVYPNWRFSPRETADSSSPFRWDAGIRKRTICVHALRREKEPHCGPEKNILKIWILVQSSRPFLDQVGRSRKYAADSFFYTELLSIPAAVASAERGNTACGPPRRRCVETHCRVFAVHIKKYMNNCNETRATKSAATPLKNFHVATERAFYPIFPLFPYNGFKS